MKPIKTIGHSNHPIERFVELLKAGGVERLVDVRSMPWSRRFPQFGRERLAKSLAEAGIAYAWEGEALGGKPKAGGGYDDLAARPEFKDAIGRLIADRAEHEPVPDVRREGAARLPPHRAGVPTAGRAGVPIEHLLADGTVRPHREIEEALLKKAGGGADLFEDRQARLARAYQGRERTMKGKSA